MTRVIRDCRLVGWLGMRDVWWWSILYDDKFWEYRWSLLEGEVGVWFLVRVSFALDHTSNSLRTQRVCGAIEFTAKSTEPHADPSAVRVDHGFEAGREAYRVGKVVEFPISEWWCIDHENLIVYAKIADTPQRSIAFFQVVDDQTHHSCRFLTHHWIDGDFVRVYKQDGLNCTLDWVQIPDNVTGVTNATLHA